MCLRCDECHSIWLEPQISLCKAAGHVGVYDDEPEELEVDNF